MSLPDTLIRTALAGVCLAALATPVAGDDIKSRLDDVQRDLHRNMSRQATLEEKAREAEGEIRSLKLRAVELAQALHQRSEAVDRLEKRLATLEKEEFDKAAHLARRRGELTATLAALQRIARLPAATLIAMPRPPNDTIRSAILLRSAVPELNREANRLRDDISELTALRAEINSERGKLDSAFRNLKSERKRLAALTSRKMELLESTRDAERTGARDAARLSAEAGNLRELLDTLSRKPGVGALEGPDFEPPPGSAREKAAASGDGEEPAVRAPGDLPVPGRIVTAFGDRLPNGLASRGVSIAARASSPVVAPKPGRVVFAGNFRGYGNLVILELSGQGHALIAGLGKINAEIGDEVLAGEPLGEMTPSTSDAPRLYFELRQRGQPINPLPHSAALRTR